MGIKLFSLLKSGLLGRVDSGFYAKNKVILEQTNYLLLKKSCIFSLCMCVFLFILTFFNGVIKELVFFYLFFVLFFAAETWIVLTYVKKDKKLLSICFYIFAIAILFLTAYLGTFKSVDAYAVTFYVFLIIIPVLRVSKPIYGVILSISACLIFCLMDYFAKSEYPQVAANDILNAVCCCIVGIGVNLTIINLYLDSIQSKVHLENISVTDELTSLPNRRSFNLFIDGVFARPHKMVNLIMIDIDDFKSFNDGFGHLKGDECLRKIGEVFASIAAKHNLFVARFGGEEFIAVDTSHTMDVIAVICEEIIGEVGALNIKNLFSPLEKVTISIGYVNLDYSKAKNYMTLINYADDALYISKRKGKNRATMYNDPLA